MKVISKADIVLFSIIILICLGLLFIFKMNSKPGYSVRIMVDGELVETYDINQDKEYNLKTHLGENVIVIDKGEVYVSEADCPDKICVNHAKISNVGETIICLPHKLVVEIDEE